MTVPSWQNDFYIEKWHAYLPDEDSLSFEKIESECVTKESPDFSFIPAMTRRRLSFLTKMSLFVADKCFGSKNTEEIKIIFASQHGELQNSMKLLHTIAKEETLSPALFSLSVHNAAAGVFTILSKNKSPHCFVSAGEDTLLSSIIEALGYLSHQDTSKVLLVMADDEVPDDYKSFVPGNKKAYAIGLMINNLGIGDKVSLEKMQTSTKGQVSSPNELVTFFAQSAKSSVVNFSNSDFILKHGSLLE